MIATEEVWLPEKFTIMIEALHTGMMAYVSDGWEVSESFSVTNGVSKVVYWPPRSSPSFYQQCSMRLSETWGGVYIQSR